MKDRTNKATQSRVRIGILGFLFVLMANCGLQAQDREVSGQVTTLDGPLMGAAVVLKGTSVGVATDEEGKFVFPKPLKEDDILVITYLGYETYEQKIGAGTSYVRPFLQDIAVVIVGAARTAPKKQAKEE